MKYHSLPKGEVGDGEGGNFLSFWTVCVNQNVYYSLIFKHVWREIKSVVQGEPKGIWRNSCYLKKHKVLQEGINLWHQNFAWNDVK